MNHLCRENDTAGKLGESRIYSNQDKWWISTDDSCCHTEINFCPYCGVNLFLRQVVNRLESKNDLSGYLGIFKNEKPYDIRTVAHLTEQVSTMKKEHVREMVENSKIGTQILNPEYLQILLNRLESE